MDNLSPIEYHHILVCDQSKSVVARLTQLLSEQKNIVLVNARDITQALELLAQYQPRLIIIGNSIFQDTNTSLLRSINESPLSYNIPILALPQSDDFESNSRVNEYLDLLEPIDSIKNKIISMLQVPLNSFKKMESMNWLKNLEVLVAEDSASYMHIYKEMLVKLGLKTKLFINGSLAWDYLQNCQSSPDLIITDIIMPEMTGMELVRRIRSNPKFDNTPIIVSSTISQKNQLDAIFSLGANDFFSKPINYDFFFLKLKYHLKTRILLKAQKKLQQELSDRNIHLDKIVNEQTLINTALKKSAKELKFTQKKLIESEKMLALTGLVTGMAHEINTPLGIGITAISHTNESLKTMTKSKANSTLTQDEFANYCIETANDFELIKQSLKRCSELINNFKSVSVTQSGGKISEFNLKNCLSESLFIFKDSAENHQYTINLICKSDMIIRSYPDALSMIIDNLLHNSVIHGFPDKQSGCIEIRVSSEDNDLTLVYSDNGLGIDKDHLNKIFDPFFTTKRNLGLVGLGTNIIYNLVVQRLNGSIICSSEKGENCIFTLKFPVELIASPT